MIVKMKKVSLIVLSSLKEKALHALGSAEVFHTGRLEGSGDKLQSLTNEYNRLNNCLSYLPPKVKADKDSKADVVVLAEKIAEAQKGTKHCDEFLINARKEITRIEAWGDFNPAEMKELNADGLYFRLYELDKKEYEVANKANANLFTTKTFKGKRLVVAIAENENDFPVEINAFDMPKLGLSDLKSQITKAIDDKANYEKQLAELAKDVTVINVRLAELDNDIEFEKTLTSMSNDEELSFITGYIPASNVKSFSALAATEGWAVIYTDPTDEEQETETPTLTKHYGVGAFAAPVLKMFDLTPGYKEFDITFFMFFFFSLFFAMIIGDGGYGALFLIGGLVFVVKKLLSGQGISAGNVMFLWVSMCTVAWGAVSGIWFGAEYFKGIPFLKQFMFKELEDPKFVQKLTFMVGAVHLSIGHIWAMIRNLRTNFLKVPADIGNFLMVGSLYYLVLSMLLPGSEWIATEIPNGQLPSWVFPTVGIGFLLVVLFDGQEKGVNPIKAALFGIVGFFPTFLNSIGNFSDIISYIRLYAVGLAGLAIAQAFNEMALNSGNIVMTVVVLLAAHTLNIALCVLSVVVHGLRLNSLEFSNHLGLKWAGSPYKPYQAKNRIV